MDRTAFSNSILHAMDIAARVVALTQLAGVPASKWPRSTRGLMDAYEHFKGQGINLSEEWVSSRDMGIASSVFRKARKSLDEETAKELTQDILGGLSLPSHRYGEIGAAADHVRSEVLDRGIGVGPFRGNVLRHTQQKVMDRLRHRNVEMRTHGPGTGAINVAPGRSDDAANETIARTIFTTDPDLLAGDALLNRWVHDAINRMPGKATHKDIARKWVEDPGKYGIFAELGREFGVHENSIAKVIKKKIIPWLADDLANNRRVMQHIYRQQLVEEAQGFGRLAGMDFEARAMRFIRYLKAAAEGGPNHVRVAHWWLQSRRTKKARLPAGLIKQVGRAQSKLRRALSRVTLNDGPDAYRDLENFESLAKSLANDIQFLSNDYGVDPVDAVVEALGGIAEAAEELYREIDDEGMLEDGVSERVVMELVEDRVGDLEGMVTDLRRL